MAKIETKLPVKNEKREPSSREDIWSPLESLRREIDKLFETFRPAAWSVPFGRTLVGFEMPSLAAKEWQIAPAVDLVEKNTEHEISAELPGLEENLRARPVGSGIARHDGIGGNDPGKSRPA